MVYIGTLNIMSLAIYDLENLHQLIFIMVRSFPLNSFGPCSYYVVSTR
jgi:hypothetical protein